MFRIWSRGTLNPQTFSDGSPQLPPLPSGALILGVAQDRSPPRWDSALSNQTAALGMSLGRWGRLAGSARPAGQPRCRVSYKRRRLLLTQPARGQRLSIGGGRVHTPLLALKTVPLSSLPSSSVALATKHKKTITFGK